MMSGKKRGTIDEIEKQFINNVFEFDDKVAADIMTHRTRVVAVSIDSALDDIVKVIGDKNIPGYLYMMGPSIILWVFCM